jgi:hypothetical protein
MAVRAEGGFQPCGGAQKLLRRVVKSLIECLRFAGMGGWRFVLQGWDGSVGQLEIQDWKRGNHELRRGLGVVAVLEVSEGDF